MSNSSTYGRPFASLSPERRRWVLNAYQHAHWQSLAGRGPRWKRVSAALERWIVDVPQVHYSHNLPCITCGRTSKRTIERECPRCRTFKVHAFSLGCAESCPWCKRDELLNEIFVNAVVKAEEVLG